MNASGAPGGAINQRVLFTSDHALRVKLVGKKQFAEVPGSRDKKIYFKLQIALLRTGPYFRREIVTEIYVWCLARVVKPDSFELVKYLVV